MNLLSGIEQDHHRPQTSPGAYEWWNFDGFNDDSGHGFSAQFYAGHLLSPYYQGSLRRYWKDTSPGNASPLPPRPLDFCGVQFRVFGRGSLLGEFLQESTPGQLKASEDHPALLLGPNRFHWDASGDPPSYMVTLQGRASRGLSLRARLFFTPERTPLLDLREEGPWPTHTWILAAPRCRVEGTIQWCDAEGDVKKEIPWTGKGYHDHHFGTVPPGRFLKSWCWGRAFQQDGTIIHSTQVPVDKHEPAKTLILGLREGAWTLTEAAPKLSRGRWTLFGPPYSKAISDGKTGFRVRHRRSPVESPASLLFEDEMIWKTGEKTHEAPGLSNYLHFPRLSNPVFFPYLKAKTDLIVRPTEGDLAPPSDDVSLTRPPQ